MKCDYCNQPAIQMAGETNSVLVCNNHAPNARTDFGRLETYVAEYVNDSPTALRVRLTEAQWNALEMARKAEQAERRAEDAEAEVERLRDVLAEVRRAFDLQCPPDDRRRLHVDRGAWMAHSWWNTVLGGILNREAER